MFRRENTPPPITFEKVWLCLNLSQHEGHTVRLQERMRTRSVRYISKKTSINRMNDLISKQPPRLLLKNMNSAPREEANWARRK